MEINLKTGSFVSLTNPMNVLNMSAPPVLLMAKWWVALPWRSCLQKIILMKTHNCATSTISVDSSNWRKKHSQASVSFLSCSTTSTAIPSHRLIVALRESCTSLMATRSMLYFWSLQKRLSAALRKTSFTLSPSLNGFLYWARTWLTR